MKKPFLTSIFTLFLLICSVSCNDVADKGQSNKVSANDNDTRLEADDDVIKSVPSFESQAIQDYVNSYEEYLNEYTLALENNNLEALSELRAKGQELALKAQEISRNMSVEDSQKFTHYMTEKAKTIQELTSKIAE